MKTIHLFLIAIIFFSCKEPISPDDKPNPDDSTKVTTERRDPYRWPFSETSIWNMPIGSRAVYVPANLEVSQVMSLDEDYIVMTPNEPLMKVYKNDAGWGNGDRCVPSSTLLFSAPIPQSWEVSMNTWDGTRPNAGLAVLMPDGKTVKQAQPFAHCTVGGDATAGYVFADESLYGEGMYGAHGASGLSALGGALRYDELTPTSGPIRHVLKINVFCAKNLYYDAETKGYRWPAKSADSYAGNDPNLGYGRKRTKPVVKECRMGALLALPATMDLTTLGLETEPAKTLAKAFQDYGAYIVDDTAWDVNCLVVEWGPSGRFKDEFKKNWGYDFATKGDNAWGRDLVKIYNQLHVVDNNTANSVGGGGRPRQSLAPPFKVMK